MDDKKKKKQLAPVDEKGPKKVVAGYEYLCPGREKHLALRFRDRPGTAVDGDDFPAEAWEKSPAFLGSEFPFEMAMALTGRSGAPPGLKSFPPGLDKNESARAALVPIVKKWVLQKPVTAWWFVVHDTATLVQIQPTLVVRSEAKKIHLWVGLGPGKHKHDGVFVQRDYGDVGGGAKFETLHPEFVGKFLHTELNHGVDNKAEELCTEFQYDALVRLYLSASYRAGKWLTVASHREVDRGIAFPGKKGLNTGHWDPRGFDFERFYRMVAKVVGLPEDKTFGILQKRHDFQIGSFLEHRNTFPVQYGPVQIEDFMPVRIPGARPGVVLGRPVPIVASPTKAGTTPNKTTPTPNKAAPTPNKTP